MWSLCKPRAHGISVCNKICNHMSMWMTLLCCSFPVNSTPDLECQELAVHSGVLCKNWLCLSNPLLMYNSTLEIKWYCYLWTIINITKGVYNYLATSSAFFPDVGACRQASHLLSSTTVSSVGVWPPRETREACMVSVSLDLKSEIIFFKVKQLL